ncbi:HsdR family type I site-specific deoxyribonuclease [Cereibacter sphaeroides]|uniref:type I restriction endonuclease subunit R n=1 Tax=Cereibacter sphaeroides TaxID=1063 RepID=UPI000F533EEA|nr:HsdR family type I site-specific deoxyribonuclease [Cereibacter sphaeroides]AZB55469.1 HsdR family type I site-specific deoxyribonuclease [Cereibacter sphaeroides]AZB59736.1 HsdR family type I site-specific deoxyribonuclease [Cereibacter sphaeroides]
MAIGDPERATQNRVIGLMCGGTSGQTGGLGWRYLGDWHKREGNANIEADLLRPWLVARGYDQDVVTKAIAELQRAARMDGLKLYEANRATHDMLRYGVQVIPGPGEAPVTVRFVDWGNPAANDLGVAEEVAVTAKNPKAYNKRPDLVLYVNGIAMGVVELKKSTVDLGEGIRQTLDNQRPEFIRHFFTTIQITFAGNDMQGLRYASIQTPQPYWLAWKEDSAIPMPFDRDVSQMLAPARFLELINDFILFDAGIKKVARPNQYFAVKAAQEAVQARKGGIIWQTQGSGKSLIMVMMARWIREARPDARILVVTDRKELDEQIEAVFGNTGDKVRRARSGADLLAALADPKERVVASLVHKFGRREEDELGTMIAEIQRGKIGAPVGEFFVFIDEAHRTQSGKLAAAMRMILPEAVFYGFTGTPLLRSDKRTSLEVFGPYIGTPYRFNEAVEDGVVLDLRYEARDIDQRVASPGKIDAWFEAKTKGLTPVAKATLKQRWGTLQRVLSSKDRLAEIASDIIMDMELKPRLKSGRGNAMLVAGSIPEACRLFEIFRGSGSDLAGKCAIVTSYKRNASELTGEEAGMGETDKQYVYRVYDRLMADLATDEEAYETEALRKFRKEPGQMKLLIVVSRLLTGFDAPTATYIYIDKQMRDHGLFQAICRVNRLDGEDKPFGYVVDYKDLFKNIEMAVEDYTSEAFDAFDAEDVEGLISNRATKAGEDLMTARDAWFGLLDPVEQPKGDAEVLAYFSNPGSWEEDPQAEEKARRRQALYKLAAAYARAFAAAAEDPAASGVNDLQLAQYRGEVDHAIALRDAVRLHSGDAVDMKQFEPAMRHLIDTYIKAEETEVISHLDDISLIDLVATKGAEAEETLSRAMKGKRENVAEAIENNVRRLIIDETPVNPKFYERMSDLLTDLVQKRRDDAIAYAEYLQKIAELVRAVKAGHGAEYPPAMNTPGRKALYDNLDQDEAHAQAVDAAIRETAQIGWRGNKMKERMLRRRLAELLEDDEAVERIIEIIRTHDEY